MAKKNTDLLAIVKEKTDGMETMLREFQITNDEQLAVVSDKIRQVKNLQKFIEQEKEKLTAPAKAIIAEAKEKYDPYIAKCKDAETALKGKAGFYMEAKETARIEAEKKIAARVEKGTMKVETAVKKIEDLPEAKKNIRTEAGSGLRMSKKRVAVIENPELVPDEYWVIDEVRARKDALAGKEIPGIVIREESILSSI